jgi:hypothetical protein
MKSTVHGATTYFRSNILEFFLDEVFFEGVWGSGLTLILWQTQFDPDGHAISR